MNNIQIVLTGWVVIALMMTLLWFVQRAKRDAGVVDVGWAAGLGLLALLYAALLEGNLERRVLVALLAGAWSFRLAFYLLKDRVLAKEEDGRYQELRSNWGAQAQRNFFIFFQVQGVLDVVLSLPFLILMQDDSPLVGHWAILGVLLWAISVCGESLADSQLSRFRSDPGNKGRTCRVGLWRYSRHPNYFFEWLHWLSYPLMAVGLDYAWLTLLSPVLMLFFILKVTGIPPTEARALRSRGEEYRRYQETTSAFFPWWPRKEEQ
jgi:steroid 5-alpha reductase family enzyme